MTETRTILDLCSGTGAWSQPYVEAGYHVIRLTLPENDVRTYQPPEGVHGILAAPPCTEFSLAKAGRPRDFASALEVVDACLRIVRECRLAGSLQWWAMENPRAFLRQFIGQPALSLHYWWYGDCFDKPTDLWGYFEFPRRLYREPPMLLQLMSGWSNWNGEAREQKAITPPCFARAFFEANP